jgi:chromosome partitioning protein
MRTIVSVNAKGGCGKSTIAMNVAACLARRGFRVLLIDTDPQAQVSGWLRASDGINDAGTITAALAGTENFADVISMTDIQNLWFVPSSQGLEELSREMTDVEGYYMRFASMLATEADRFDFTVIDSPNQVSPVMESVIWPADLFIVPFESTKAVRSYANFYQLVLKLRPGERHEILHVLSNLSKQVGLRRRVIETMMLHDIEPALSEVRTCGWLAQVDEHGGDIFAWRPHSIGAMDIDALTTEVLTRLEKDVEKSIPAQPPDTQSAGTIKAGNFANEPAELPHLGTFKIRGDALIPESQSDARPSTPEIPAEGTVITSPINPIQ